MSENPMQTIPFHAINEFMRSDYRLEVVRTVLISQSLLPPQIQTLIERLTRKSVQIPGFRNSAKAPVNKRIRLTAEVFEKSPQMTAAVLSAWSELKNDLRQQVFEYLTNLGWELLPVEIDRSQLPGFSITWPKGGDLEELAQKFLEQNPAQTASQDDVSLMIVWLGGRLPYQMDGDVDADDGEISEDAAA